jgi:hypothetical protein
MLSTVCKHLGVIGRIASRRLRRDYKNAVTLDSTTEVVLALRLEI